VNDFKKYLTWLLIFLAGGFTQKQVGSWDWFINTAKSVTGF